MLEKIIRLSSQYSMLKPKSTITVGLSGGADSVCLTSVLKTLSSQLDFSLRAIHVNHNLRGEESLRDLNFCSQLCKKMNIPFIAVSCNVKNYADEKHLSVEEAARILRYKAFADNSDNGFIATAHNANDNLETVIHNLTRGSAIKGLCGIPPVRDNIIRPLLEVTRSEIENYLAANSLPYITDSTNLCDDYTRNKIRHNVIPLLEQINSSVVKTSINSICAVRLENSFIDEEVSKAINACSKNNGFVGLKNYHKAIRQRCITSLLSSNSLSYDFDRLEAADAIVLNGGKINVSGSIFLICSNDFLRLENITSDNNASVISTIAKIGDNSIFSGKTVSLKILSATPDSSFEKINKKFANNLLDYDKIIGTLLLRNRKFGDRIQLCGRNFTSSVKKFINENISPAERLHLHFLEDDEGTLWAEKIGVAQRAAPNTSTTKFLCITISNDELISIDSILN
ncbi:MAG: tRNA lysidine(34) synthetase TilS [Ruminococcus sp.]|jgi:tRNA(Ile)-lysidine synthase|nr:tRNA lysidine(34) synthetase TilS [Ruminococcus sp.]